jgi:hypothetical protein
MQIKSPDGDKCIALGVEQMLFQGGRYLRREETTSAARIVPNDDGASATPTKPPQQNDTTAGRRPSGADDTCKREIEVRARGRDTTAAAAAPLLASPKLTVRCPG